MSDCVFQTSAGTERHHGKVLAARTKTGVARCFKEHLLAAEKTKRWKAIESNRLIAFAAELVFPVHLFKLFPTLSLIDNFQKLC